MLAGHRSVKEVTRYRMPVSSEKHLAMTLHFLVHGLPFAQLSMYSVGKSTGLWIVQETVAVLKGHLVPNCIRFPEGAELGQVVADFEQLAGLPQWGRAIN